MLRWRQQLTMRLLRRAMELENKKARDAARKSYSEEVRSLAMWLKRRDPRVKEHEVAAAAASVAAEQKRKQDAAIKSAAAAAAAAQRTAARAAMLKEASQR
jgi:DnaJ family protein A protein 5